MKRPNSEGMVSRGVASRLISLYGHLSPVRLSGDEIGERLRIHGLIEWVSFKPTGLPDRWRETPTFGNLTPTEKLARAKQALYSVANG